MSALKNWLVKVGILSQKSSAELSTTTSKVESEVRLEWNKVIEWLAERGLKPAPIEMSLKTEVAKVEALVEKQVQPITSQVSAMYAMKVFFHRIHRFIEPGAPPFTAAQIAAATYKIMIGSSGTATIAYPVPPQLYSALPGTERVTVPFTAIGFKPKPGVEYHLSVVATVDGIDGPASETVKFINSYTPAPVDTVSVA